ncbi:putative zinc finger, GRF-type [Sesbania bispinosa]|nr:putative zinc finger, GRF-type [Sesbania bispinosa]
MASQSFSLNRKGIDVYEERTCLCGHVALMRTSWSEKNLDRRYLICPLKANNKSGVSETYD